MITLPELPAADLAALLASKLCHDVISPVFGIQSGLELLDDMPNDPESMELVRKSLKSAVAKLQFARIAFGAAGSPTAMIDLNDAKTAVMGYMEQERADLVWEAEPGYVVKNFAKLVMNLVVLANSSVSRGGEVRVTIEALDPPKASISGSCEKVRLQPRIVALLDGDVEQDKIDAQAIQPYYTLFLAKEIGLDLTYEKSESMVTFTVR